MIFLPETLMGEKKTSKPQLRNIPQNIWPMLFKTSKVMQNKESLISHRPRRNMITACNMGFWMESWNEWRILEKTGEIQIDCGI